MKYHRLISFLMGALVSKFCISNNDFLETSLFRLKMAERADRRKKPQHSMPTPLPSALPPNIESLVHYADDDHDITLPITQHHCDTVANQIGLSFAETFNRGLNNTSLEQRIGNLEAEADSLIFDFIKPGDNPCISDASIQNPHCSHKYYNVLWDKWVYFYGDSTIRQLWETFLNPFKGKNCLNPSNCKTSCIYSLYKLYR